jgi:hypothetical protein
VRTVRITAFLWAVDPLRRGTLPTGVPVVELLFGGGCVFELDDEFESDGGCGFELDGGVVVEVEGPVPVGEFGGGVRAVEDVVASSSPPQPTNTTAIRAIGRSLLTAGARGATSSRAARS